jgi:hypothetical protein
VSRSLLGITDQDKQLPAVGLRLERLEEWIYHWRRTQRRPPLLRPRPPFLDASPESPIRPEDFPIRFIIPITYIGDTLQTQPDNMKMSLAERVLALGWESATYRAINPYQME